MVVAPTMTTDMTVMTDEVIRLMEEDRKRRLTRVRNALGFKKGDGRYVRYKGPYIFPNGKGYYVFTIIDPALKGCHTGLTHYALLDIRNEKTCRQATADECLDVMMHRVQQLYID